MPRFSKCKIHNAEIMNICHEFRQKGWLWLWKKKDRFLLFRSQHREDGYGLDMVSRGASIEKPGLRFNGAAAVEFTSCRCRQTEASAAVVAELAMEDDTDTDLAAPRPDLVWPPPFADFLGGTSSSKMAPGRFS